MATIDIETLLQPVSEDSPCGDNLEYDPAFGELERAAQGQPERVMGNEVIAATEPLWAEVFDQAQALLERTRDLRVAISLTRAGFNLSGFGALADGMKLIAGLIETFWDRVYPELDADDNNDPTLRINSLVELNNRQGLIRDLSRVPLVEARGVGRFGLRDIQLASGELTPVNAEEEKPDGALIDAAFMDCDVDELKATAEAVSGAADALKTMLAFIVDKVGASFSPDLDPLTDELRTIKKLLGEKLALRGVGEASAEAGAADTAASGGARGAASGEITSHEDVVRALDKVSAYFRKNEPSSPIPLLLERAKRLVDKDFMEILRDMAPDGVSSAAKIAGISED